MDLFNDVLPVLGGVAGLVGFSWTWLDRRRRMREDRRRGAAGVTAYLGRQADEVGVRNDGPLPIVVNGTRFIQGVHLYPPVDPYDFSPLQARSGPIGLHGLVRPGEELTGKDERPPPLEGQSHMTLQTLVVRFTDHSGQVWELCERELRPVPNWRPTSMRGRRQIWLERQSWMRLVEFTVVRRATLRTARHPRRPSVLAWWLDWFYGWRVGTRDAMCPLGQPRSWRYSDLVIAPEHLESVRRWKPRIEYREERQRRLDEAKGTM